MQKTQGLSQRTQGFSPKTQGLLQRTQGFSPKTQDLSQETHGSLEGTPDRCKKTTVGSQGRSSVVSRLKFGVKRLSIHCHPEAAGAAPVVLVIAQIKRRGEGRRRTPNLLAGKGGRTDGYRRRGESTLPSGL